MTYAAYKVLRKAKQARRMLVIPPLRPLEMVWPQEQAKWTDFADIKVYSLHGKDKDKTLYDTQKEAAVFLMNPEGLPWLMKDSNLKILNADILAIDELAKWKDTRTQRFKTVKKILPQFKRRWGLTGSPAAEGYEGLFGQAYMLDLGAALGPYVTHFRVKYFYATGFGGYDWKLQDGAAAKIEAAIAPIMLRMENTDYVKLPTLNVVERYVTLPPAARTLYKTMEDDLFAELGSLTVTAINAATGSSKCRQIANGALYYEKTYNTRETEFLHEEKINLLEDLVTELQGTPVLIAYEFEFQLEQLKARFGKDFPYIGGGVPTKQAVKVEGQWNRSELPYLGAQWASVSHGLNLQGSRGNHIAMLGITWKYDDYDQFIRRLRRPGSKHAVVYAHHILARDTIEQPMFSVLKGKGRTQDAFLKAMKGYALERGRKIPAPAKPVRRGKAVEDDDIPF